MSTASTPAGVTSPTTPARVYSADDLKWDANGIDLRLREKGGKGGRGRLVAVIEPHGGAWRIRLWTGVLLFEGHRFHEAKIAAVTAVLARLNGGAA